MAICSSASMDIEPRARQCADTMKTDTQAGDLRAQLLKGVENMPEQV